MACYNGATFLPQAIESVLSQTLAPTEFLIVDDGSTDESADIIRQYGEPVRLIQQSNQGRAAAFNRAMSEARGEAVALIDADDFWLPDLVDRHARLMSETGSGLVYGPTRRCDEQGRDLAMIVGSALPADCLREMLVQSRVNGCGLMFRTALLREVGEMDGRFWPGDDYHLWLRMAARTDFAFCSDILTRYRMYASQASADPVKMAEMELAVKRDFFRLHPWTKRQLGKSFVRYVTQGRYLERSLLTFESRRQLAARKMMSAYLKRWPWDVRAYPHWLRAWGPWSVFSRAALPAITSRSVRSN
jgi:glycosyltransferase involved in cell wall biosynthesis